MTKSNKTNEELETLCEELELRVRRTKELLKEISKIINKAVKEI